ncbi:UNVERIFIED_CONTAM: movement protein [Sesamum calycinum]|uniref:Movement protein n=1 Tax=Sesamum calycinum TaxID=2727403 RepID=A0AAW2JE30_9LAMI
MNLQPSQNNYNEGDRLQTSENLSGFFSRMTVSNKTMQRIMRQDSNLSPYDGFRIGGISKVLNQIGLNQRKHHIIYKVSSGEFAIPMKFTGNVMEMQLIRKEEILEELSRLRKEIAVIMKWIHIGTIEIVINATFKEGIDSEIHLSIMDRRINNLRDGCLGTMIGNLYAGKLMFDIHPRITYNLTDQDFSRVLTLHQDFKRKDLMKEGNRPYSITYRIAYALSNTHHSDLFLRKEYIEIPIIFKEFVKVMAPDLIRIPRIGGVDIVIKDHPVLDRTISSRTEFSSRMSFSEDRIMGYKGKEKDLLKALTPQEIRVDNVKLRCPEGWKEIQVIFDITKNENFLVMTYINHGEEKGTLILTQDPKFAQQNLEFSLKNEIQVLRREKAFNRIMPINFRSKRGDFDAKLTHLKMQDKRKFGKVLLSFRQQGLIDSDSFYEESVEEIRNLKEALQELKTMEISEESKLSLENVKRLTQRNFSENPLAWWDRNKIEVTLKIKEECKYNSHGFLVNNHGEIKRGLGTSEKNPEELNKKFGRLAVNAQVAGQIQRADLDTVQIAIRTTMVASTSLWNDLQEPIRKASSSEMTNELRKHDPKHALRVQDSRPVAVDSSTACTRPSPNSGATAKNESQRVETSDDSSQPSASGVKEEEISLRPMTGTSKANTNELSSSSSSSSAWQRPDMVAFNRIKAASEEAPLVSAISEDDISTRRAWGLWVYLTEMDKVKYPFKIFSNKVNGSFLLNSMTGKSTDLQKACSKKRGCSYGRTSCLQLRSQG